MLKEAYFTHRISVINRDGRFDDLALPVFACQKCGRMVGDPRQVAVTALWPAGQGLPCGMDVPLDIVLRFSVNGSGLYFAATPVLVNSIVDVRVFDEYSSLELSGLAGAGTPAMSHCYSHWFTFLCV